MAQTWEVLGVICAIGEVYTRLVLGTHDDPIFIRE